MYTILGGYRCDLIVILDVQNLQAPEAPAATPEAGPCFLGSLQVSIEELVCINRSCVCVIDRSIGLGACSKTKSWKK